MANEYSQRDLESIGESVIETAYMLFSDCGEPDDFCVQHVGSSGIVFGGTNRVVLGLTTGWRLDEPYCRDAFITKWHQVKHKYGVK